jgi:hypothetical protein
LGHSIFCIVHPILSFVFSMLNICKLGALPWFLMICCLWLCIHYGGGAMSWQSHKQATMAFPSTTESRYILVDLKEALWLWQLLKDLGFVWDGPTCLHCDNWSCIKTHSKCLFSWWIQAHWITNSVLTRKIDLKKLKLHFTSTETSGLIFITKSLPIAQACTLL